MGSDKALLKTGSGLSVLDRTIEVVQAISLRQVLVVDSTERYRGCSIPKISDLYPDTGPLGGIITGLRFLRTGRHIVVSCDLPRLSGKVLQLLLNVDKSADVVVPMVAGRLQPLCAVYSYQSVELLQAEFDAGERSISKAIVKLRQRIVSEEELKSVDPEMTSFFNLNTPQDLERYRT